MTETAAPDLLIEFLQTRDNEEDSLATAESAAEWFARHGLMHLEDEATDDEARAARHARAALRALFSTHDGGALDGRSTQTLDDVNRGSPLRVTFEPGGAVELEPVRSGLSGGLAMLMALVYRASVDGTLGRYKACKQCGWAFYDGSKNRSRVWCDMATCGSQVKARSYRARQKSK